MEISMQEFAEKNKWALKDLSELLESIDSSLGDIIEGYLKDKGEIDVNDEMDFVSDVEYAFFTKRSLV